MAIPIPNALNTNSTLSAGNSSNKTSTSVSTNIIIYVNNTPIGAIQRLSITETRGVKFIDEVGTDGHIDSVPNTSTNITLECERIRFDNLRISEAFSRGFIHASSQIYPFDIVIIDKNKSQPVSQITTVVKSVWIKSITQTYTTTDWAIAESMSMEAETIYSHLPGNNPAATGGERQIPLYGYKSVEQLTDKGGRRGSLDSGGLFDIANSGQLF